MQTEETSTSQRKKEKNKGTNWFNVRDRYNHLLIKEGWLEIRGKQIKTWRRCYFLLFKDAQMFGFKNNLGPDFQSVVRHVYYLYEASVKFEDDKVDHERSIFTVSMWLPKERTFAAQNDEERYDWANAIKTVGVKSLEVVTGLAFLRSGS